MKWLSIDNIMEIVQSHGLKVTVSVHRQPMFLNLVSRSLVDCEFLHPKCGPLQPHLTA